jgi:hypothetical protein
MKVLVIQFSPVTSPSLGSTVPLRNRFQTPSVYVLPLSPFLVFGPRKTEPLTNAAANGPNVPAQDDR